MHIRQISAALDTKVAQLDKQLKQLQDQQQRQGDNPEPNLLEDITALNQMRDKLLKSKDLAWRAHQLRDANDEERRARQRAMGLAMCGVSLLGALLLIYFALQ
ncbi:hypothetical protein [Cellvibrio fontiphilus]|jgi:small-conductance mechanosensitive channel|uniref:Uncharacterized protein n=1 Tax=Cellvibrio fontiphilus TaxID=1815559 RepID=A0ABV7FCA2_9GAMM|nr:hypothetical protein [Cellvibrio fontiphilus]